MNTAGWSTFRRTQVLNVQFCLSGIPQAIRADDTAQVLHISLFLSCQQFESSGQCCTLGVVTVSKRWCLQWSLSLSHMKCSFLTTIRFRYILSRLFNSISNRHCFLKTTYPFHWISIEVYFLFKFWEREFHYWISHNVLWSNVLILNNAALRHSFMFGSHFVQLCVAKRNTPSLPHGCLLQSRASS